MAYKRILLTGAAGALGRVIRSRWAGRSLILRLSDVAEMEAAGPQEELAPADLADAAAVAALCEGVKAIVHFGGQSREGTWEQVHGPNILGLINLYEGARKAGVERVVFASSNHAVGFNSRHRMTDHTAPVLPDSRYGVSKAFGEDLAQFYALKHGIRTLAIRIGSCFERPSNARMLSTWLSYDDLMRLVDVGLTADYRFEIVYGVSNNDRTYWDNSNATRLGYRPMDNAEVYAGDVGHILQADPMDENLQGGQFCSADFSGNREWIRW